VTILVADALVARLRHWGIHRIFGDSGDGVDPVLAALRGAGDVGSSCGGRRGRRS
jgi:pyruvate dehydrogenase (quinone)